MSDSLPTIKVKSTHRESQGPFVEINESDFDPAKHERYVEPLPPLPSVAAAPPPPPAAPADPLDNLPANWRDKDPGELKSLAGAVAGRAVENKRQAVEVIEAGLAKRAK